MVIGCPMYILQKKLQLLKSFLERFEPKLFWHGNVHHQVTEKNKSLDAIRSRMALFAIGQSDFLL